MLATDVIESLGESEYMLKPLLSLSEGIECLNRDGVLVFPTETSYALGCRAFSRSGEPFGLSEGASGWEAATSIAALYQIS